MSVLGYAALWGVIIAMFVGLVVLCSRLFPGKKP